MPALLYGPPGTGKTSLIEAAFGEEFGDGYQPLAASGEFPDPVFGHPVELLVTDRASYRDSGEHWRRAEARQIARRVTKAVIDELDTDIHPLLVPELFRWFYDKERNKHGAQLLFTAHNPAILNDLEKEQVFFTEKPSGQPTRIYGAREIKGLRREPSLMKKYLSGELGAVPHIG